MRWLASLALSALVGCAGPTPDWMVEGTRDVDLACDGTGRRVELTYLRAGGIHVRWGDTAVMTAPFYSNPNVVRVGLAIPVWPNESRILDALVEDVGDTDAILVGHAHYDHAMDLPLVATEHTPEADVYGSETLVNLLASELPGRLTPVAGGGWIDVAPDVRVLPLEAGHAPHFLGIKLFDGSVDEPRKRVPRTAYGWKEGQTFAYLIDLLGPDRKPAFASTTRTPPPTRRTGSRPKPSCASAASTSPWSAPRRSHRWTPTPRA